MQRFYDLRNFSYPVMCDVIEMILIPRPSEIAQSGGRSPTQTVMEDDWDSQFLFVCEVTG